MYTAVTVSVRTSGVGVAVVVSDIETDADPD
jgi:hypothetical protein